MKNVFLVLGIFLCLVFTVRADESTFYSSRDTEVDEEESDVNKGEAADIQIGSWGEIKSWYTKGLFDFSMVYKVITGYEVVIDQAVLELSIVGNDHGNAPVNIFRAADAWEEASVTWNTRPDENRDINVIDTPPLFEPPATLWEIDVTEIVRSWYQGFEQNGFYLDVPGLGIPVDIDIASRESGDSTTFPRLRVSYHSEHVDEEKPDGGITFDVSTVEADRAVINFSLPASTPVLLKIYDASGTLAASLVQGPVSSGSHAMTWSGESGVYFARLVTPTGFLTGKFVLTE